MLKRTESTEVNDFGGNAILAKLPTSFDLEILLAAARRQTRVLVVGGVLGLILGFGYVITAVPQYTAMANILIDSQKDKDKSEVASSIAELTFDSGAIDSQVELLKSEKIAMSVVSQLKLTNDPDFMGTRSSLLGQAWNILLSAFDFSRWFVTRVRSDAEEQYVRQRIAIGKLESNLDVRRVGHTFVLSIYYTSPSQGRAAQIANAFAEAYLTDQLDAKFEATRRASGWMQARITELKEKSLASDSAVQKFKADNGLITADGKLVSDQQMTELNTQMVIAQSETARAEARYNQINELLSSGQTDGAVTDSLGSPVITELRQKFLAASKLEAELESKLGNGHLAVVNLKHELDEYRRLIFEELKRIAETYKSEGQVARAKEESLSSSMSALVGVSAGANQTMVQLRELEREAESYRTLYQTFLQRYQETIQQQSFPIGEARIITGASPPGGPSYPKRPLVLSFSLVLGIMAGAGIGALREYRDRVFRVASQVRDELGMEFLGMLQVVEFAASANPDAEIAASGQIDLQDSVQRYAIDHPLSSFSETLRSVKVAADLSLPDRKTKIIGIISALPGEGKSTVAKNLGSLLAHSGARSLIIDGDLRNPGLSKANAPNAQVGLLEAIRGERPLHEFLLKENDSGAFVLPAVVKKRVHHTSDVLSSAGMRTILSDAAEWFDYVVVDLPPLGPVVDVRAAASMFDAFVFVVEWGRTSRSMVRTLLSADEVIYEKCIGVVFNKVQLNKINLYESHGSKDFYYGRYSKYYRTEKELV